MRQNIIDGLSKWEFLFSKLSLILFLSFVATLFLFFQGLITGLIYSTVKYPNIIFSEMEFLASYFLEVITFLSFALFIGTLLKRAGFSIVLIFMYTLIFEPFLTLNLQHNPHIPESLKLISPFLPVGSLNNLISVPFQRYVFMEIQDIVAWKDVFIFMGWLVIYHFSIYKLIGKKRYMKDLPMLFRIAQFRLKSQKWYIIKIFDKHIFYINIRREISIKNLDSSLDTYISFPVKILR